MFAHVTLHASDLAATRAFYATVLGTLGVPADQHELLIEPLTAADPATRGLHLGFGAASRADVGAFWRAGLAAGAADDGAPGPRPQYTEDYYGGFLLDPDANSAEAMHTADVRRDGVVDHLWVRVADLAATRAFYLDLAPQTGYALGADSPERVSFNGRGGSISFLPSPTPTANLRLGFLAETTVPPRRDPDGNAIELVAAPR